MKQEVPSREDTLFDPSSSSVRSVVANTSTRTSNFHSLKMCTTCIRCTTSTKIIKFAILVMKTRRFGNLEWVDRTVKRLIIKL